MPSKIAVKDNAANQRNANKGAPGTNRQYDQAQGNRGNQLQRSSVWPKKPAKRAK
jgi:hypothetical protein